MVIDMSNYLPNTIDLDKATKKYGNEKNYNILQITYKNFLEIFINSLIDFKSIEKIIKDSNLEFKKINDESYNIYHRESKLDSDYIFIRNNIHIENLNDEQTKSLIENNLYETFITDTINEVLKEKEAYLSYSSDSNNVISTKGLIFEFAYDGSELIDLEKTSREVIIKQIFDIIKESLKDCPFDTNFIIYDKTEDYFRPKVKDRNSLLNRLKIVKNINYAEQEDKQELANKEINEALEKTNENDSFISNIDSEKAINDLLVNKLDNIKKKRDSKLSENDKILEDLLSDSIVEDSLKKETLASLKESNDLLDSIVNKEEPVKEEKKEIKEEKKEEVKEKIKINKIVIEDPEKTIENKEYIGTIGNKKYIIRYVSSFTDDGVKLNIYDYSINGCHNAYYTEIKLDYENKSIIETLFGLENLKEARKNNTSYLGNVKDNYLVREKVVDSIYLLDKLVRRENSNIVIIENVDKHKDSSKNYYYILNLSTNKSYKVNTETDIFSNVNSNEELAKWLTDEVLDNSFYNDGYIGKLGLNGVIIKGA